MKLLFAGTAAILVLAAAYFVVVAKPRVWIAEPDELSEPWFA